jgi:hypothetical protein
VNVSILLHCPFDKPAYKLCASWQVFFPFAKFINVHYELFRNPHLEKLVRVGAHGLPFVMNVITLASW